MTVVIALYPNFKLHNKEWELFQVERNFISNLMEALVSFREGRAQSELNFSEFTTNADLLHGDGKEAMETIIDEFRSQGLTRIGKRF
jgi:hypothetical protein